MVGWAKGLFLVSLSRHGGVITWSTLSTNTNQMTSFRQSRSISNFLLLLFSLCVSTIRYTCELLLHQVWERGLPGSQTSEHIQGSMLLYWNARSRLGKPLWNLPHQGRGCVRFLSHGHKHMRGNTHIPTVCMTDTLSASRVSRGVWPSMHQ